MIKQIIDILVLDEFYGSSERIDIAKGKYKLPSSIKESGKLLKRIWKSKK
jgi:hypothetical protein